MTPPAKRAKDDRPTVRVLQVASEAYPLVKTGGLADVVGALPAALERERVYVTTLVPGYQSVIDAIGSPVDATGAATDPVFVDREPDYPELMGGPAWIRYAAAGEAGDEPVRILDAPHLFRRDGNPYVDATGRDWPDNALRFGALARVAADMVRDRFAEKRPFQLVHAHDWQTGLVPAFLRFTERVRMPSVMTIHNLAFQGQFSADLLGPLGLPKRAFTMDGVEYFGGIGFLKAGIALADRITTVSPGYAAEILTSEGGMGLDGLLRKRAGDLRGILNGIDTRVWDPSNDDRIPARFDGGSGLKGRAFNKSALQDRLGLHPSEGTLLYGVVTRLTWQKGMDLLLEAIPHLLAQGAQLAVLGSGDFRLEEAFAAVARAHPGRIAVVTGYDEGLAHGIQAGADALLVPSRFEPCGLTQLCALRYGAIPVVARTGGLADTVVDANEMALAGKMGTGVVFSPITAGGLRHALDRTKAIFDEPTAWRALQKRAMATDVSWARPAAQYAELYRELLAERAGAGARHA